MSELAEKLIEQALSLPADERRAVAERLLCSLEPELSSIDQFWAEECEDRTHAISASESLDNLSRLKR